jgi:PmbA protein
MAAPAADLTTAVARAVEAAISAGAEEAEAYAAEATEREVRVHGGEVESLTAATQRGVGVRAWIGTRVGYAYGTDLSDAGLARISSRAAEGAAVADEDEFAAPPRPGASAALVDGLSDPSVVDWPTPKVVELALTVERTATEADSRMAGVEQAVYADSAERVAIRSSTGVEGDFEASSAYAFLQAVAVGVGGWESGLGFGLGRGPADLDPVAIGSEGAERALSMIGAGKPVSRICPIVLDATVAASFAGVIGGVLGADAVQRGRSPLANRLGEQVASEVLVLSDDGLDPEGLGTSPFDGEGVPRRRTPLIEDGGHLRNYLHDTYTALRGDTESTGNAGRGGYRSQPGVAPSNLVIGEGGHSFDELVAEAEGGVYVTDVAGLHSGVNPVSGMFSVGAAGREISGGELAGPVREFTIASDLIGMLRRVTATGSEARWVPFGGSVRTPAILVSEMTVSGA